MSEAFDELVQAASAAPIPQGAVVLVAVSGGPDSVALLAALHALAPTQAWTLYTGHVNHSLRGQESDTDECFVVDTAAHLGVPCLLRRIDVIPYARAHHVSLEEAAR